MIAATAREPPSKLATSTSSPYRRNNPSSTASHKGATTALTALSAMVSLRGGMMAVGADAALSLDPAVVEPGRRLTALAVGAARFGAEVGAVDSVTPTGDRVAGGAGGESM